MARSRNAIVYNAGFAELDLSVKPDFSLSSCTTLLRQRHERVSNGLEDGPYRRQLEDNLLSLRLAEACMAKENATRQAPGHPLQIAIIGPTQSGKSSLVNLVLGETKAQASPLAGFTVHPQGFPLNLPTSSWDWLDCFFDGYRRVRPEDLPGSNYAHFALYGPVTRPGHPLPPAMIWDTPDFDSVDAMDYRNAVLRTIALADVLLLVVSKDKYADQSVWDLMKLLEPLGHPTIICLNKVGAGYRDTLVRSLREKWRAGRQDDPAPVVVLPWIEDALGRLPEQQGKSLTDLLVRACEQVDRKRYWDRIRRFIAVYWPNWLAPIRQELEARKEWDDWVNLALAEALSLYRRDFLNYPDSYETFQRALAELLTLLEIPGLASGMAAARRLITWPVRQIARLGGNRRHKDIAGREAAVLKRITEHLFIHLGQGLLEKSGSDPVLGGFWRELGILLREEHKNGESRRAEALARHIRNFQPEIERTAHQLHEKLREHPGVLNTLRATRLTTDAAALALALHTGGIGVQDFIIAPAILSVTSLLAESALGHYLQKAEMELKERQFRETERLFDENLRPVLTGLPLRLDKETRFNIPADMLNAAEALLHEN